MSNLHESRFDPSRKAWAGIVLLSLVISVLTFLAMSTTQHPSTDRALDSCNYVGCDTRTAYNGVEIFDPTPAQLTAAMADAQHEQNLVNIGVALCVLIVAVCGLFVLTRSVKRAQARIQHQPYGQQRHLRSV